MTDRFSIFSARLRKVSLTFAFLSGGAMMLMMLAGSFDIIGTYVFYTPIPAAFEFIENMGVVVAFFAISLAQARRAHIRVELVYGFMPRPMQFSADVLQFLLSMVFYGLIAWFGWRAGLRSFEQGEIAPGIINYPLWPARFALFLGASLMTVQCAVDLIGQFLGHRDTGPQDREPVARA